MGEGLFSLEIKNYYPYDILNYRLLYDIYEVDNLKDNFHVNFISYNRPVINSIPLYFYALADNILPSFNKDPPSPEYKIVPGVNPVFVLKNKDVKFYCDNGECLPSPMPLHHFHYNMQYDDTLSFGDCLNVCKKQGKGILNTIEQLSNKESMEKTFNKNIFNNITIIIIILLCLGVFFIFIYNKRRWIFG